MSGTYTTSQTNTFTKSHAEYLARKVKTDLMRFHRYYGRPSLKHIEDIANISKDAIFTSFLMYNSNWDTDSAHTQKFLQQRPFSRTTGDGYSGNWSEHRTYSAGCWQPLVIMLTR